MAYIDKSRAIGMLERFREEHSNLPNTCLKMIDIASNIIKQIPTADVVEMVRCEDCKHFCEYSDAYKGEVEGADGDCYIRLLYSDNHQFNGVKYDDYCSYGKKGK